MRLFRKLATAIPNLIVGSILIISCSEKEDAANETRVEARISAGIQTRAVDTNWEKNDCIGLHIFETGTNNFVYNRYNYRYHTPEGSSLFKPNGDDIIYYPLDGSSIDFVGYYPYDAAMTGVCVCKADVSDQTNLSAIDLMTSERFMGASRSTPEVTVKFHHRLSKLIFRAFYKDKATELPIEKVVIKGMNTAAAYSILTEALTVNANSEKTLEAISRDNKKVEAIVIPRQAGEGVTFLITSGGTEFTAHLSEEQEFKSGFKYTFNLLLDDEHGSAPTVKAIIQEWVDGGKIDTESKLVTISNGPGEAIGFNSGDVITLYHENMELTNFTYDGTDWTPETPVYWENIGDGKSEEITLRAMFQRANALNKEQMPEVFLAETTTKRYESIYLHFKLAPAKVVVKLTSESEDANEKFSSDELAAATVLLPSYISGYEIANGIFTLGTKTGNINLVDRQALIAPQKKNGTLAIITLNGNQYSVVQEVEQEFLEGKVYTITVDLLKSKLNPAFNVSYTDWTDGDSIEKEGTPVNLYLSESTANFKNGDMFTLYNDSEELTTYTYNGSVWTPAKNIYWEELNEGVDGKIKLRAQFVRKGALNNEQMAEVFLAETDCNRFEEVKLEFKLAPAKIIVVLKSESTTEPGSRFMIEELERATVLLKQYQTGGSIANGVFTPGTTSADINAVDILENKVRKEALIEPQKKTGILAHITLLGNVYKIEQAGELNLQAGSVYTITVNMLKSKLNPSFNVSYTDWADGSNPGKDATPVKLIVSTGTTSNFTFGNKIKLYDTTRDVYLTTYEYEGGHNWKIPTGEPALYWQDIGDGCSDQVKLRAEFIRENKLNDTQLPELFLAETTCSRFRNLSFQFKLVPAKVSFVLKSEGDAGLTFNDTELKSATIVLPEYVYGYTLEKGVFTTQMSNTGVVSVDNDQDKGRRALIIPQTKSDVLAVVTINDVEYEVKTVTPIEFKEGVHTEITVNITKTNVTTFSASYTDWDKVNAGTLDALRIQTGSAATNNFVEDDKLSLYYYNDKVDDKEFIATFNYDGNHEWSNADGTTKHYWQNLNNQTTYKFYAVSTLKSATSDSNQMDDVMYAEPDPVSKLGAIDLKFTKKTSKINVVLTSDETFSEAELRSATITLPAYRIGAKYTGISYTGSTGTGNITVDKTADTNNNPTWTALFEPQTIAAGAVLIKITIAGVDYELKKTDDNKNLIATTFLEANQYTYTINMKKTGLSFSASYTSWTNTEVDGGDIGLD